LQWLISILDDLPFYEIIDRFKLKMSTLSNTINISLQSSILFK
jgi:hypothetical protein